MQIDYSVEPFMMARLMEDVIFSTYEKRLYIHHV